MPTVDVEYIGHKARKEDNVAGSGIVWAGPGDVKPVSIEAWGKLSRHPDVWRLAAAQGVSASTGPQGQEGGAGASADAAPPGSQAAEGAVSKYALGHADGTVLDLAKLTDKQLRDFARSINSGVDLGKKGEALCAAIFEAVKAATGAA